jgi:regulator of cell morphogenesis and NO signaling
MTVTLDRTIRDIVAEDYRTAAVFQRYGLDFCCKGNRTVEQACIDAGISADEVQQDLQDATELPQIGCAPRFNSWDLPSLITYIVSNHHAYVRAQMPVLQTHAGKVARVHGERHPEMVRVAAIVDEVVDEMSAHMTKEEQILFPYITRLAALVDAGAGVPPAPFGTVQNPIRMMEAEHESAGDALAEITRLTNGYRPPADACGTFVVLLQELQAFEEDLHRHVHLENNILFPKAVRLESGDLT